MKTVTIYEVSWRDGGNDDPHCRKFFELQSAANAEFMKLRDTAPTTKPTLTEHKVGLTPTAIVNFLNANFENT